MELQFSKMLVTFVIVLMLIQNEVACNNPTLAKILGRKVRQLQYKCPYDLKGRAAHSTTQLLKVRNTNDDSIDYDINDNDEIEEDEISEDINAEFDLSEISEKDFLKLIQSGKLQIIANKEENKEEGSETLTSADEDDERSKKRPWRKVQRILRRQLIKLPKRYLKKFIRKVGFRRELRSSPAMPTLRKMIPKNELQVQEVEILMQETETGAATIATSSNGRFDENRFFVLNSAEKTKSKNKAGYYI